MLFFKQSVEEVTQWRHLLKEYFRDEKNCRTFTLVETGEVENRSPEVLFAEIGDIPGDKELGS